MNTLDYVILGALAISLVIGFLKGFIKQLLAVGGVVVITTLTATVTPYVDTWIAPYIESEGTRAAVAMFGAVILLAAVYGLVGWIIGKILKKVSIIKVLDKVLGGVVGIVVVYLIFAVVFALLTQTGEIFLPRIKALLGDSIDSSWFAQNVYGEGKNFFGDWVINGIAQRLLDSLVPPAEAYVSGIQICA